MSFSMGGDMGKRSDKKRKQKRKSTTGSTGKGKRYSPGEIFMAVLGAALIIMFGVIALLAIFG
jgi:uncharacterized OsmC-like protein